MLGGDRRIDSSIAFIHWEDCRRAHEEMNNSVFGAEFGGWTVNKVGTAC